MNKLPHSATEYPSNWLQHAPTPTSTYIRDPATAPMHAPEETLEVYKNRLQTATYPADREDALDSILAVAAEAPVAVGSICLAAVVRALPGVDSVSTALEIVRRVLATPMAAAFEEIVAADEACLAALLAVRPALCADVLGLFRGDALPARLGAHEGAADLVMGLLAANVPAAAARVLATAPALAGQLVFEGAFEKVLTLLEATPRSTALTDVAVQLLSGGDVSQRYFVDAKMHLRDSVRVSGAILHALLDPASAAYAHAQAALAVPAVLGPAVQRNDHVLLFRIVQGDTDRTATVFAHYIAPVGASFAVAALSAAEHCPEAAELYGICLRLGLPGTDVAPVTYIAALLHAEHAAQSDLTACITCAAHELSTGTAGMHALLLLLVSHDVAVPVEHSLLAMYSGARRGLVALLLYARGASVAEGMGNAAVATALRALLHAITCRPLVDRFYTENVRSMAGEALERVEGALQLSWSRLSMLFATEVDARAAAHTVQEETPTVAQPVATTPASPAARARELVGGVIAAFRSAKGPEPADSRQQYEL